MKEYWDVRTRDGRTAGKVHERGIPLGEGEYQLVVYVWVITPDGRHLVSQRLAGRKHALKWECTGGSVLTGETSLQGACREVLEETGVVLCPSAGRIVHQYVAGQSLIDVWLFHHDVDPESLHPQEDEVADIRLVTTDDLLGMYDRGEMLDGLAYFQRWLLEANPILSKKQGPILSENKGRYSVKTRADPQ